MPLPDLARCWVNQASLQLSLQLVYLASQCQPSDRKLDISSLRRGEWTSRWQSFSMDLTASCFFFRQGASGRVDFHLHIVLRGFVRGCLVHHQGRFLSCIWQDAWRSIVKPPEIASKCDWFWAMGVPLYTDMTLKKNWLHIKREGCIFIRGSRFVNGQSSFHVSEYPILSRQLTSSDLQSAFVLLLVASLWAMFLEDLWIQRCLGAEMGREICLLYRPLYGNHQLNILLEMCNTYSTYCTCYLWLSFNVWWFCVHHIGWNRFPRDSCFSVLWCFVEFKTVRLVSVWLCLAAALQALWATSWFSF